MIHSIELIDFLAHHDTKLEFNNDATVFVGQNGAGGFHDLIGDIIFGSDQFQADALAFFFGLDKVRQEGVVHRGR